MSNPEKAPAIVIVRVCDLCHKPILRTTITKDAQGQTAEIVQERVAEGLTNCPESKCGLHYHHSKFVDFPFSY